MFGDPIDQYCAKYNLKIIPEEYNEKVNWEVYRADEGISIYTEDSKIKAVSCSKSCFYKGTDLIEVPIERITSVLNLQPDMIEVEELIEGPQEVYDFDEIGLQLWVKNGKIVTAIFNGT